MTLRAYLAGPDVFLPNAAAHAQRKIAICARHGIIGCAPVDENVESPTSRPDEDAWRAIFRTNMALMQACDIILANLTPFRGASADAGTLVELGWFLGRGRPAFGYSNSALPFTERSRRQMGMAPDPVPGMAVEDFGLPDNLMIAGALRHNGGAPLLVPQDGRERAIDALDIFERCVAIAAQRLGCEPHSDQRRL